FVQERIEFGPAIRGSGDDRRITELKYVSDDPNKFFAEDWDSDSTHFSSTLTVEEDGGGFQVEIHCGGTPVAFREADELAEILDLWKEALGEAGYWGPHQTLEEIEREL